MNAIQRIGLIALATALTGCAMLEGDKIDYKSANKAPTLEVPPDLTQLSRDARYVAPRSGISASTMQATQAQNSTAAPQRTAATELADIRIERDGKQRWLVVNRPADQLWEPVREFWLDSGFTLPLSQPALGIMETDWAENRAKLPQDFVRATLGKLLDSLYSTGERDKFRTRLERTANGGTEIYITHRGMEEVFSSATKEDTLWQPRAADPELETEFLRRLMVRLGADKQQAAAAATEVQRTPAARMATVNNLPVVQLNEPLDRAWRRVGLSLDRTGFSVEDRNRSEGVYFVRYVAPVENKKEPGFFSKLFSGSTPAIPPLKYRIALRTQGDVTTVSILNETGAPDTSPNAERIVRVLVEDLQ